jgi:hypothetical protein
MMDEKDVGDLMLNNGKNTSSVSKLPKNGRTISLKIGNLCMLLLACLR